MSTTLGTLNPFRYRGYVYGEETALFYLRSRYYNPVWDRFLNADSVLGKPGQLLGHNVFAYCRNNPTVMVDVSGYSALSVAGPIATGAALADGPLPFGEIFGFIVIRRSLVYDTMAQPSAAPSTPALASLHVRKLLSNGT